MLDSKLGQPTRTIAEGVNELSDVFLSYAREDLSHAQLLAHSLEAQGWSVWWDRAIPVGKAFDEVIEQALGTAKCVVVIWSKASITSRWVAAEAEEAQRRNVLLPILVDPVRVPLTFRRTHTIDLIDWSGALSDPRFQDLLKAVKTLVGPTTGSVPGDGLDVPVEVGHIFLLVLA